MIKFSIRTNRTRALERAPLVIPPASAALLADLYQMVSKTRRKGSTPARGSKPQAAPGSISTRPTSAPTGSKPAAAPIERRGAVTPRFGSQSPASTPAMRPFQRNTPGVNGSTPTNTTQRGGQAKPANPTDRQPNGKPFQTKALGSASPVKPAGADAPRSDKPASSPPPPAPFNGRQANQDGASKPDPDSVKSSPAAYNGFSGRNGLHNGSSVSHNGNSINHAANGNGKAAGPQIYRPGTYPVKPQTNVAARPESPGQKPLIAEEKPPRSESSDGEQNGKSFAPQPPVQPVQSIRPNAAQPRLSIEQGLEQLYKRHAGLPEQTAVLGVCEDGLPVLLNLDDPAPGAVVVVGDEREEQIDLLHSAVTSLASRNSPRSVQFMIISCNPETWKEWISAQKFERYIMAVEGVEDVDVLRDWIVRLADWTEQRRLGQRSGPPVVLVMDTLSFLPRLSIDVRLNFEWMAKEGPPAHIWQIAAISADLAQMLHGRRMLRSFKTRILGFADNPTVYTQLANVPEVEAAAFGVPEVFAVQVGDTWLRFKVAGRK